MFEKSREREIGMRHGGITGFEVKIGRDGGISEPGTGPSLCYVHNYWKILLSFLMNDMFDIFMSSKVEYLKKKASKQTRSFKRCHVGIFIYSICE